jgi:hypothetical protein
MRKIEILKAQKARPYKGNARGLGLEQFILSRTADGILPLTSMEVSCSASDSAF